MKRGILLILFLIFLLRLSSFFEPYWYGDEGIYLALGQAVHRGAVLYRDIWDNKPPLLYLLYAIIPSLVWAKLLATLFVLGTISTSHLLSKKLKIFPLLVPFIIGILLSIPFFEGTIANAELFFTLPIILGAYFLFIKTKPIIVGFCLASAFLLKVPAVFDFVGLILAWFVINKKIKPIFIVGLISLILILPIFGYFYINNGLSDFLTASFLQNAAYVSVDTGPFSKLTNPLFLRAGLLLLTLIISLILFVKNKISQEFFWLTCWLSFSLYGALLSNRPYLHYLLQIIPPTIIFFFYIIANFKKYWWTLIFFSVLSVGLSREFSGAFHLGYPSYYINFFDYISERKSWDDFANYFDGRTTTNYKLSYYLKSQTNSNDNIFVWGDNAFIYVLSETQPTTKFIQAHHLTTIPSENYDLVANQLMQKKPKFIVVIQPVNFSFPKLNNILKKSYEMTTSFGPNLVYKLK